MNGPQRQGAYDIIVHNLLLPNVKQWNAQVIRDMFDYVVAEEIFQVPLVEEVGETSGIGKKSKTDVIVRNIVIDCGGSIKVTRVLQVWMGIGVVFGILRHLLELNIYCGEYVRSAYRLD